MIRPFIAIHACDTQTENLTDCRCYRVPVNILDLLDIGYCCVEFIARLGVACTTLVNTVARHVTRFAPIAFAFEAYDSTS